MGTSARSLQRDRATAIHEAGHAAVAIITERRFQYVTIVPDADTVGHVRLVPPRSKAGPAASYDYLTRCLAGYYAEREFGLRPRRFSWDQDRQQAVEHALSMSCGDEREAALWVKLATLRAKRMMSRWKPSIEALAHELLITPKIDFERAREIVLNA